MRILSGIKPTGELTLGNYIGAIKNFVLLQKQYPEAEVLVFIADLHALTTYQDKKELKKKKRDIAAMYLACGLDKDKTILFNQSEIAEHNMLGYIMECVSYIGEMERMTQYKDKKKKQVDGIRTSLLTYPALMAADILLYDANIIPIGDDQKQHLELTRNLANRFNSTYGNTFIVPEGYISKVGKRIMNLQDPLKKMSKSEQTSNKEYISLLDNPSEARNKIKSAITDSDTKIIYDIKNKPGISNLLNIYASLTDISIKELEKKYINSNYATFKADLGDIVYNFLTALQERYNYYYNSKELDEILDRGANIAKTLAKRKIDLVYKRLGLNR